jgi:hypothetical protein
LKDDLILRSRHQSRAEQQCDGNKTASRPRQAGGYK